jgi:uncharacterized protein (DUF1697 family)
MAHVLFLKGVNVGGHKTFKPSALAKELAHLDAISIGAAGTFVIHKSISQSALKAEVLRRLPFEPQMMICRGIDVLKLAAVDPFATYELNNDVTRYVTILAKRPGKSPRLPITEPAGNQWQVKFIAITGCFVMSLHRRAGKKLIYPNEVAERMFNIQSTTRNWNTIEATIRAVSVA